MVYVWLILCFICPVLCPLWIVFMIAEMASNKKRK